MTDLWREVARVGGEVGRGLRASACDTFATVTDIGGGITLLT